MLDETGNQLTGEPEFEKFDIAQFRAGDPIAFKFLFTFLHDRLFKYAVSMVKSDIDAEKAVAEAFYQLFHARQQMHSFEEIVIWLYQTATRLLLLRKQNKIIEKSAMADWLGETVKPNKLN
jgi:DNA-directed RNA polymerase specialized sigma24 family protein